MLMGLTKSSLDLMTRDIVRLHATMYDTGLNLAVHWLSSVEMAEKFQSIISSVNTAWMDRRQLNKISCRAQIAASAITHLFLYFQYQATVFELRKLEKQQVGYSAECSSSVSRYKNI
jgi:hypothetical protein